MLPALGKLCTARDLGQLLQLVSQKVHKEAIYKQRKSRTCCTDLPPLLGGPLRCGPLAGAAASQPPPRCSPAGSISPPVAQEPSPSFLAHCTNGSELALPQACAQSLQAATVTQHMDAKTLLLLQIRTQPHLGCCLAAATAAASAIFMHLCTNMLVQLPLPCTSDPELALLHLNAPIPTSCNQTGPGGGQLAHHPVLL
jgi:hypothetical protein